MDQWVAVAECVRDKGYDYPDPEVDDYGNVRRTQTEDQGFMEATDECIEAADLSGVTDGEGS
jgi:hypothetical protein